MILIIRFFLFLIFIGTISSCRDDDGERSVSLSIDRIRSDTGLIVPDGSILEHFGEPERLIDPIWVAKVIVPISSYMRALNRIYFREQTTILSSVDH